MKARSLSLSWVKLLALWFFAVSVLSGCSTEKHTGTLIWGGPEDDQLARGELDPARVDRIFVYVYPRPRNVAYHYEDLADCRVVVVAGAKPGRELVDALGGRVPLKDLHARGQGPTVSMGTIRVVLRGEAEELYLSYELQTHAQYVRAYPHKNGTEGAGSNAGEFRSWFDRYVLVALEPDSTTKGLVK